MRKHILIFSITIMDLKSKISNICDKTTIERKTGNGYNKCISNREMLQLKGEGYE